MGRPGCPELLLLTASTARKRMLLMHSDSTEVLGATTMAHLALPDGDGQVLHVHARLPPGVVLRRGEAVSLLADPERAFAFPLGLSA